MSKDIKCFGRCWTRRECLKAIGGVAVGTLALASGIVWLRGKKSVYELGQESCRISKAVSPQDRGITWRREL
jgi:hypothetical protein